MPGPPGANGWTRPLPPKGGPILQPGPQVIVNAPGGVSSPTGALTPSGAQIGWWPGQSAVLGHPICSVGVLPPTLHMWLHVGTQHTLESIMAAAPNVYPTSNPLPRALLGLALHSKAQMWGQGVSWSKEDTQSCGPAVCNWEWPGRKDWH